jgi:hypothetical protein
MIDKDSLAIARGTDFDIVIFLANFLSLKREHSSADYEPLKRGD